VRRSGRCPARYRRGDRYREITAAEALAPAAVLETGLTRGKTYAFCVSEPLAAPAAPQCIRVDQRA